LIDYGKRFQEEAGLFSYLKKADPKIIGFSGESFLLKHTLPLMEKTKQLFPEKFLLLGGAHVSGYQERAFKEFGFADCFVIGEGEYTTLELAESIIDGNGNLKGIKGIIYKKGEKIIKNEPRQLIKNLDELPLPAREFFDIEQYGNIGILTSRGCPFGCIYCDKSIFGRSWRGRSPENIVDELEFVADKYRKFLQKSHLSILDDVFNVDMGRAKKICDEIVRRNIRVDIKSMTGLRADRVDAELLQKMKKAGWTYIQYGIETGDEKVMKNVNKGEKVEDIVRAIELTKKAKIKVGGSFIIDLPGTNSENIKKTEELLKKLQLDVVTFNFLTPMPNTLVWEWVHNSGEAELLMDVYDSVWDKPVFTTKEFTAEEKIEAFKHLHRVRIKILRKKMVHKMMNPRNYAKIKSFKHFKDIMRKMVYLLSAKQMRKL